MKTNITGYEVLFLKNSDFAKKELHQLNNCRSKKNLFSDELTATPLAEIFPEMFEGISQKKKHDQAWKVNPCVQLIYVTVDITHESLECETSIDPYFSRRNKYFNN